MNVPEELYYSSEHEWVRVENGEGVVGITDHAQEQLGDVVFVELPDVGAKVAKDESAASLESVKAVSEVYIPVAGEVTAVNDKLADAPETINDDPYGEGWILRLRFSDKSQLDDLMSAKDYAEYVAEEGGE